MTNHKRPLSYDADAEVVRQALVPMVIGLSVATVCFLRADLLKWLARRAASTKGKGGMTDEATRLTNRLAELNGEATVITDRLRQDTRRLHEIHQEASLVLGNLWDLKVANTATTKGEQS